MNYAIADTGPLVALIDKSDKDHERCVEWFKSFEGQFISTDAVLTEALYLLNLSSRAQMSCLDFFIRGIVELRALGQSDLKTIRELMTLYQNVPMDFADATVVNLANQSDCCTIFILDVKDFSIYRPKNNKYFDIYPK
ncbi:pilus assembly protein [candidate division KSB1 bacterium]|nr:pilus assembly protein [candidate division KSB1 bacterium]